MKGVVITTDAKMFVKDFTDPLYETVGQVVGGWIERVQPKFLPQPFCMIVDDEGLLKNRPVNIFGSVLYDTFSHGNPIVGDIVIMAVGFRNGERDIIGLTDEQIAQIKEMVSDISDGDIEEVAAP